MSKSNPETDRYEIHTRGEVRDALSRILVLYGRSLGNMLGYGVMAYYGKQHGYNSIERLHPKHIDNVWARLQDMIVNRDVYVRELTQ